MREVITTLMSAGLDAPIARLRLSHCGTLSCRAHCTWERWRGRASVESAWPDALRDALVELGPAFVKIGQVFSVRADLVPPKLAVALRSLQSDVPGVDPEDILGVAADELDQPLEEFFGAVDRSPLAVGSIAQVHRATLKDGREVVLKVKRPGLERIVRLDLEVLRWLAGAAERRSRVARGYRLVAAAEELRHYTLRELDFRQEAMAARRLRVHHASDERVRIPEIHYASESLIVMEYIESFEADARATYALHGLEPRDLLHVGIEAVISEIFELGVFHADPHPGNLHVTSAGELVLLDFGIFGELDEQTRRRCALTMWALVRGDVELAALHLVQLAQTSAQSDVVGFRNAVQEKYVTWRKSKALDYGLGRLVFDSMTLAARYGLDLPSDTILVGKALTTVEGLILWVDPEVDLNAELQPHLTAVATQLFDPRVLIDELIRSLPAWWHVLERIPSGLALALDRSLTADPPPQAPPVTPKHTVPRLVAIVLVAFGVASVSPWAAMATGAGVLIIMFVTRGPQ